VIESGTVASFAGLSFAPTQEEAAIAGARAGLRTGLRGRLSLYHVAPLVAFGLALAFIAILAFTGLIGRRFAEIALILAAAAFMAARMTAHLSLRRARNRSLAATAAPRDGGEIVVRLEEDRLVVEAGAGSRQIEFADCVEAELAGGMVYVWPRQGPPAFVPARVFANDEAAQAFATLLRERIRIAKR
jgi:hypothetical protein